MSVVLETTMGDITIDLFTSERPRACLNFLKLCKCKYYNYNLFHTVSRNFIAQTGDPSGGGEDGCSVFGLIDGPSKRYFQCETQPRIKHSTPGLISFVGPMMGSQFFLTLGSDLTYLDDKHCVFGEVVEGMEILAKINEAICDDSNRPYQDIRITHTVVLYDPFADPSGLRPPSRSPSPTPDRLKGGRIAADEEIDETHGKTADELREIMEQQEAKARATILEMVGDLPDAEMAPPENVLFVCKLNPVTSDDDLEIIFSRFGRIVSCEVIRDRKSNESLQYAFVEFEDRKACEDAYFKMDNVLIDDRRIHVDFSQSVSKVRWLGKGRGVRHDKDAATNVRHKELGAGTYQRTEESFTSDKDGKSKYNDKSMRSHMRNQSGEHYRDKQMKEDYGRSNSTRRIGKNLRDRDESRNSRKRTSSESSSESSSDKSWDDEYRGREHRKCTTSENSSDELLTNRRSRNQDGRGDHRSSQLSKKSIARRNDRSQKYQHAKASRHRRKTCDSSDNERSASCLRDQDSSRDHRRCTTTSTSSDEWLKDENHSHQHSSADNNKATFIDKKKLQQNDRLRKHRDTGDGCYKRKVKKQSSDDKRNGNDSISADRSRENDRRRTSSISSDERAKDKHSGRGEVSRDRQQRNHLSDRNDGQQYNGSRKDRNVHRSSHKRKRSESDDEPRDDERSDFHDKGRNHRRCTDSTSSDECSTDKSPKVPDKSRAYRKSQLDERNYQKQMDVRRKYENTDRNRFNRQSSECDGDRRCSRDRKDQDRRKDRNKHKRSESREDRRNYRHREDRDTGRNSYQSKKSESIDDQSSKQFRVAREEIRSVEDRARSAHSHKESRSRSRDFSKRFKEADQPKKNRSRDYQQKHSDSCKRKSSRSRDSRKRRDYGDARKTSR